MVEILKLEKVLNIEFGNREFNLVRINGGYICESFICTFNTGDKLFLKYLENEKSKDIFLYEIDGLRRIKLKGFNAPEPLKILNVDANGSCLLMQYLEMHLLYDFNKLAQTLAQFHNSFNDVTKFGFDMPGYQGLTYQSNKWQTNWKDFFIQEKIYPLFSLIWDKEILLKDHLVSLYNKLNLKMTKALEILIDPVLLHGDLWFGNIGQLKSNKEIVFFDPSCYYGHHEVDLAFLLAYPEDRQRFPKNFVQTYFEALDKAQGFSLITIDNVDGEMPVEFEERALIYQLFPYLNQWVHFGEEYKQPTLAIIDEILDF